MTPAQPIIDIALEMLKDLWEAKGTTLKETRKAIKTQINKLEAKASNLMERLLNTTEASLINLYEGELKRIEVDKLVLNEKASSLRKPLATFDETYRTAWQFLANPCILWASPHWEDRRILLRLAFVGRIPYCKENGYRTAKTTLPFNVLREISDPKSEMVPLTGETSNTLLQTFQEWQELLKDVDFDALENPSTAQNDFEEPSL